ncbi:DUF2568 domain-containing protein [Siminovitchia acidinfaciens]|uniref:DUF2568 domain-containing protein n=1 Tax=Siminovitchia acidinfaciens TaxID=2321395 RepID=A0A429Y8H7_9BACI|nr:DUF2568 domain-containing protein [Siminovitchia acidinfaciens]
MLIFLLRFLVEFCALGSLGYWGFRTRKDIRKNWNRYWRATASSFCRGYVCFPSCICTGIMAVTFTALGSSQAWALCSRTSFTCGSFIDV